mmetsp:Transcript_11720/g.16808  ORF Transcript_11720/g.16808 Transcript_11720/m.16808 type:complete len:92 (-) Transcript_11720:681-956(-)
MMAAAADEDEICDQRVPDGVRRARIHMSVKIIPRREFKYRAHHLIYVEFHDDIEIIEDEAFLGNRSLLSVKLLGAKIAKAYAFQNYYLPTN